MRYRSLQRLEHGLLALAYSQPSHGITIKADIPELLRRAGTQMRESTALHDAKAGLPWLFAEGRFGPRRPAHRKRQRFFNLRLAGTKSGAFVQHHLNVRP